MKALDTTSKSFLRALHWCNQRCSKFTTETMSTHSFIIASAALYGLLILFSIVVIPHRLFSISTSVYLAVGAVAICALAFLFPNNARNAASSALAPFSLLLFFATRMSWYWHGNSTLIEVGIYVLFVASLAFSFAGSILEPSCLLEKIKGQRKVQATLEYVACSGLYIASFLASHFLFIACVLGVC